MHIQDVGGVTQQFTAVLSQQRLTQRVVSELASSRGPPLSARHIDAAASGVTAQILTTKENEKYFVTSISSDKLV